MSERPATLKPECPEFGRRLSLAVREAGYRSILDVCEEAGISPESMRKYRTGKRLPTAPLLLKLSRVLGVTPGWLLGASVRDEAYGLLRAKKIQERQSRAARGGAVSEGAVVEETQRRDEEETE